MSVSYLIENGKCSFPEIKPHWWFDFENELFRFPNSKHDDQCDALSQLLQDETFSDVPRIITGKRRQKNILGYW